MLYSNNPLFALQFRACHHIGSLAFGRVDLLALVQLLVAQKHLHLNKDVSACGELGDFCERKKVLQRKSI